MELELKNIDIDGLKSLYMSRFSAISPLILNNYDLRPHISVFRLASIHVTSLKLVDSKKNPEVLGKS